MKTQVTVTTTDSVRTLVALRLRGELRLASREEVKKYFEERLTILVEGMEFDIDHMVAYLDPTRSAETNEDPS